MEAVESVDLSGISAGKTDFAIPQPGEIPRLTRQMRLQRNAGNLDSIRELAVIGCKA
jgi:hypothetical protein